MVDEIEIDDVKDSKLQAQPCSTHHQQVSPTNNSVRAIKGHRKHPIYHKLFRACCWIKIDVVKPGTMAVNHRQTHRSNCVVLSACAWEFSSVDCDF